MKRIICFFLFITLCLILYGQEQSFLSISVIPNIELPLVNDPERFTMGGGVDIEFDYKLPFLPLLSVCTDLSYSYMPIWSGDGCNFFYMGGGVGFNVLKMGKISGKIYGTAGYYHGIIADSNNESGGNLYGSGGLQAGWALTPAFDIGVNAQYKYVADGNGGALINGVSAGISTTYRFLKSRQLQIYEIQYINIFPVLYKYYNNSSIGSVVIENDGSAPVDDLEVSFFVAKYMDNPTVCPSPRTLDGGKKILVDLYAILAESVLDITEATMVSGKVIVSYTQKDKKQTVEKSHSLRINDRHAMTWDDDRKASAYVTYKDPVVIDIAKTLARIVKNSGTIIDENLGIAIALHESLKEYGITYVKDPTTPFVEFSQDKLAVDYIQFPRNTLHFKSGDCDDLSILFTAMLQAVGIDTAFITTPGHIFIAFSLSLPPRQAMRIFSEPDDIIIHDEKAWVPVEITSIGSSFLKAWKTGATEWNESSAKNEANIYPMYESWKTYEPVGYIGAEVNVPFISQDTIESIYKKEMDRFTDRELYVKTNDIQNAEQNKLKQYNKLGTVYAQYGRHKEAKEYLNKALKIKEYFPALINLGNIYYLEENFNTALKSYNRALKLKPNNLIIFLQFARIYSKMGDYTKSSTYYQKMKQQSPEFAEQYAYLDTAASESTRASSGKEVMEWLDE